jgi:hypothetical protein
VGDEAKRLTILPIVLLCIGAACVYGVLHDQVTARICLEYFTVAHPPLIDSRSPTLLALAWGIVGTWWVGLILGLLIAASARLGGRPKLEARDLLAPVAAVMAGSALGATLAGLAALLGLSLGWIATPEAWRNTLAPEIHRRFLVTAWIHLASYVGGATLALLAAAWVYRSRGKIDHIPRGM